MTTIQTDAEARKAREAGQQAAESALNDARGELYCDECGREVHGRDCPECDSDGDSDGESEQRTRRDDKMQRLKRMVERANDPRRR